MAETYDIDNPLTQKLWAKDLWREHRKSDVIFDDRLGFTGKGKKAYRTSAFVHLDEPEKSVGDKVTVGYVWQDPDDPGVIGAEVLEGKEAPITTSDFSIVLDLQRKGEREAGRMMNKQRVSFDVLDTGKQIMRDWWKTRRAVCACNHLAGNTAQTDLKYTGLNTVASPDDEHIYRVNQGLGASNDETVNGDTTATFDVNIIDELVTISEQLDPVIAPMQIGGGEYYAMLLHPDVVADIRKSNTQWYNQMIAALQGGKTDGNPIFTRALGMHRNTLIFSERHLPRGIHSSTSAYQDNTRRCVFMGAGALALTYGRKQRGSKERVHWYNGAWDHGERLYCSTSMVWGAKAIRFNDPDGTARDLGKIVVTCYTTSRTSNPRNFGQPD